MSDFNKIKTIMISCALFAVASVAKADYWMTFCAPLGEKQTYCQVGYVKPDADGFVTLNCGGYGGGLDFRHCPHHLTYRRSQIQLRYG